MVFKQFTVPFLGLFMAGQVFGASLLTVPVDQLFVPKGFDSNDNIEVVIRGHLPNLCYKSPSVRVVSKNKKDIVLKVESYYHAPADGACAEMIVPFLETVSLGVLDRGDYQLKVNVRDSGGKKASLRVEESSSPAVDQYIYAQVDYIEKSVTTRTVSLVGYNPSDCLELEKVVVDHNGTDTFSILPIMKKTSDFCPMKMVPFKYEVEIPKTLPADIVLIHARSMEGKSVNTIYPNYME